MLYVTLSSVFHCVSFFPERVFPLFVLLSYRYLKFVSSFNTEQVFILYTVDFKDDALLFEMHCELSFSIYTNTYKTSAAPVNLLQAV